MNEQKKVAVILLLQHGKSIKDEVHSWGVSNENGSVDVIAALQLMGYWKGNAGKLLSVALKGFKHSKEGIAKAMKSGKPGAAPYFVDQFIAFDVIETVVRKSLSKGVGYNDLPDYDQISENGKHNHYRPWNKWQMMMRRCLTQDWLAYKPTYKGCEIDPEWLMFSNFKRWYDKQPRSHVRSELDKDILVQGNKIYSPDTCVLVPTAINNLLKHHAKGKHMRGATPKSCGKLFSASLRVNKQKISLGDYNSEQEAHTAYKEAKETGVQAMAALYLHQGDICENTFAGLMAYRCDLEDDNLF